MNKITNVQKQARLAWMVSALLAAATFLLYFPVRTHDFQRMDDPDYVYLNPHVNHGFSVDNAAWVFTHSHSSNWHPLTWLSHMLDCQLFGLKAGAHHLVNAGIHAINSGLLLLMLFRLTRSLWCSALVAALFAFHPLHVESVAWIAERKDVLSTFFWILSTWAYFNYGKNAAFASLNGTPAKTLAKIRDGGTPSLPLNPINPGANPVSGSLTCDAPSHSKAWYLTALSLFTLGLMSKPMLVTLPFTLLLLDFWPLGRLQLTPAGFPLKKGLSLVLEKWPFFALAITSSVITLLVQRHSGAVVSLNDLPLSFRLENVLISYARYLGLMLAPTGLAVFYPLPKVIPIWQVLGACVLLLGISIIAQRQARPRPYLLFGWLWYLGTLVPVIGLVKAGEQAIADRYTYVPLIGIFIMIAWLLNDLADRFSVRKPILAVAAASVAVCAFLTSVQIGYWKSSRLLYEHAATVTKHNYAAMMVLGGMLWEEGKLDEAKTYVLEGLKDAPHSPDLQNGLGFILIGQKQYGEALPHFEQAIRFAPNMAPAWYGKGYCLLQQTNYPEAETSCARAWDLSPQEYKAGLMLALALQEQKKQPEAEAVYLKLLKQKPGWAPALRGLAGLLAALGRTDEAIDYYTQSLQTEPNDLEARNGLAAALASSGKAQRAIEEYEASLKTDPNQAASHCSLAELLSQEGQAAAAIEHYRQSLRIDPSLTTAANNLAWILATNPNEKLRNGRQAVELAETACKQSAQKVPFFLGTLAAAYAEAGRFTDAINTATKARDLALAQGMDQVATRNSELLAIYQSQRPYHESESGNTKPQ